MGLPRFCDARHARSGRQAQRTPFLGKARETSMRNTDVVRASFEAYLTQDRDAADALFGP